MKIFLKNTISILSGVERRKFINLVMLDILISALDIVFLALLLIIVKSYTEPVSASFLPLWFVDRTSLLPILSLIVLFALKNATAFLVYRTQCRFYCSVSSRLSRDLLDNYLNGPFSNYVDVDSSVHIRKINHQPIEFSHHILGGIQQIVTQLALIIFAVAGILIFKPKIFLFLLILLAPPVLGVFLLIRRHLKSVKADLKNSSDKSLQHLHEALSGFVESNIYHKNDFFSTRYADYQKKFAQHHSKLLTAQGIPSRMIEIFALVGLFILIAASQWYGTTGNSTIITIGAFLAAAYKIIPGIVKILNVNSEIQTYAHTVDDLAANKTLGIRNVEKYPAAIKSIEFKNVSFKFGDGLLFDKLDLKIRRGDFVGISGLSGKGKTTILNLLLGFLSPEGGSILVNGEAAKNGSLSKCWSGISYVKQQTFLLHDTIAANITMSNDSVDGKKLNPILEIAGLTGVIESSPEGINKVVVENGKNISGGQRQRIAIARSLYKNADLVILDEPFNELDEQSVQCFLRHYQKFAQAGKMVLLITHDKKSLTFCNKTISLDGD